MGYSSPADPPGSLAFDLYLVILQSAGAIIASGFSGHFEGPHRVSYLRILFLMDESSALPAIPLRVYRRMLTCSLCQQRKVKCNRNTPCSNCLKVCYSNYIPRIILALIFSFDIDRSF